MTIFRIALVAGAVVLGSLIFWAMGVDARPLGEILGEMVHAPWTAVTLTDLYLGFFISAAIILTAEENFVVGLFWAIPVFFLGNLWTAVWLAMRMPRLRARLRTVL